MSCPFKDLIEPKGAKGLPLINSALAIALNPLHFFTKIRNKYGDITSYKMFGFTSYLVSHPDDLATFFKAEKHGFFEKEYFHRALYDYFGNGLLNSFGKDWEVQREELKPYFSKNENIDKWFSIIIEETLNHTNTIPDNSKINGKEIVNPIVQAIMCRILFGMKPEDKSSKELIKAIELVSEKLLNRSLGAFFFKGVLNKLPTPGNAKYNRALKIIDDNIKKMSVIKKQDSLLFFLSKKMPQKQLRDQLFTLFFAGQDTTANAILWTLYHIAKYPDVQKTIIKELKAIDFDSNINIKHFDKSSYIDAVINESMRLYPPVYASYRDVKKETQIGNYLLKKNRLLIFSMWVTHRHPDIWDKPDEFIPERFLEKKNKAFSFYPYGGGKRICLGMHLAQLEIKTIVALLVSNFQLKLESGQPDVEKEIYVVLRPKNGIPLVLNRR